MGSVPVLKKNKKFLSSLNILKKEIDYFSLIGRINMIDLIHKSSGVYEEETVGRSYGSPYFLVGLIIAQRKYGLYL
jgi:hypothetical protein